MDPARAHTIRTKGQVVRKPVTGSTHFEAWCIVKLKKQKINHDTFDFLQPPELPRTPHATHPPSKARMSNEIKNLIDLVLEKTTPEGRAFLKIGKYYLTLELRQELMSPPPMNFEARDRSVSVWLERLNIIWMALLKFPNYRANLKGNPLASGPSESAAGSPRQNFPSRVSAPEEEEELKRSGGAISNCLLRDQRRCVVTGKSMKDHYPIEIAHIIPFAFAKKKSCRNYEFWLLLELFFGIEKTNAMFEELSSNINGLENLVALDSSIHSMFDSGSLSLTPIDLGGTPITIANQSHEGSYHLEVDYPKGMTNPEYTQSTRIIGLSGYNTVYPKTKVGIFYYPNRPQNIQTLPRPDYFALRSVLVWLKQVCLNHAAAESLASSNAKQQAILKKVGFLFLYL